MTDTKLFDIFTPVDTMAPELLEHWRGCCYVKSDVDEFLADPVRSVVISTYSGCGITTSLTLLDNSQLLILPYNPEVWPGQPQAFTRATTHFEQWMARCADALTEHLGVQPEHLTRLNPYQHQFLLWLLERYLGRRQSMNWQRELERQLPTSSWEELTHILINEPIDYGTTISDLKFQIHECLSIAYRFDWNGIFFTIDICWWDWLVQKPEDRVRFESQIQELLTTLAPLEVPHFGVKLGLPQRLFSSQEVDRLTRSRIKPMLYPQTYRWTFAQLQQICQQLVRVTSEQRGVAVLDPPAELWNSLQADITSIWERPGPAAARTLALVWVELAKLETAEADLLSQLQAGFYRHAAPLRLDPNFGSQIVYRGCTPIHLDDTPFRIFSRLWQHRGTPASNEALLEVAGTKTNLDKIISRLREQIEPLYRSGTTLYLQRRPQSGTWLEPKMVLFS